VVRVYIFIFSNIEIAQNQIDISNNGHTD